MNSAWLVAHEHGYYGFSHFCPKRFQCFSFGSYLINIDTDIAICGMFWEQKVYIDSSLINFL